MNNEKKEMLVVTSKVKAYIKQKEFMMSADTLEMLNKRVYEIIDSALERTKGNKRSTLRSYDL